MKWALFLVQWIALGVIGIATTTHVVDLRVPLAVDRAQFEPGPGTFMVTTLPKLAAPFVPTALGRPVAVAGLSDQPAGAARVCPNTAIDFNALDETCHVQNTLLRIDTALLNPPDGTAAAITVGMPVRVSLVVLALAIYVALATWLWRRLATTPTAHGLAAGLTLSVFGGGVLVIALIGLIQGDRDVDVGTPALYGPVTLSYPAFVAQSKRRPGEDALTYAVRLKQAISNAVIELPPSTIRFEVSFAAHWPLRVLADLNPAFMDYVYWDPYRTVHWGRGLCGPVASAFVGIARDNGLDARMVTLTGHVVATAEVRPGEWHLFDPDYGVHIPHDLKTVEANPELAGRLYRALPFWQELRPAVRERLVKNYATPENNHIDPEGRVSYHWGFQWGGMTQAELEPFLDRIRFMVPSTILALGLAIIAISLTARRWSERRQVAHRASITPS